MCKIADRIGDMSKLSELLGPVELTEEPETAELTEESNENIAYPNSTRLIVSRIAYLAGVPKRIFDLEHESPMPEIYEKFEQEKSARIIRNLCMIRTGIELNFRKIQTAMRYDLKNIDSLPDFIDPSCVKRLSRDGISLWKANYSPDRYILDINRFIEQNIDACKPLFPIWLNWDYLKDLFIMPQGTTDSGARRAFNEYHEHLNFYPYHVYLNWAFGGGAGNILYNDKKFVSLLYELHEDYFWDMSKVTDANDLTKNGIYDFIGGSKGTVLVVDCENSDPYKLYAVLKNLDAGKLQLVKKIILFNDVHTTEAWQLLNDFTSIEVEHDMVERVKEDKSLVDMSLAIGVCREFYSHSADSFVLVSSDSDYWALISRLPEARFLVMIESDYVGCDLIEAMEAQGIFYCYIDDFCTGNSEEVKLRTLQELVRRRLDEMFRFNINDMMSEVYTAARVDMTPGEKKAFYDRYIKRMQVSISADGEASIKLGA